MIKIHFPLPCVCETFSPGKNNCSALLRRSLVCLQVSPGWDSADGFVSFQPISGQMSTGPENVSRTEMNPELEHGTSIGWAGDEKGLEVTGNRSALAESLLWVGLSLSPRCPVGLIQSVN